MRSVLLFLAPTAALAGVNVGVIDGSDIDSPPSSASEMVAQLVDSTVFDIEATVVPLDTITSLADLEEYDAIVMGDSGYQDRWNTEEFISIVDDYLASGRGVMTGSWFPYWQDAVLDSVTPIDTPNNNAVFCRGATTVTVDVEHPVTAGLTSFLDETGLTEAPLELDAGATRLATASCAGSSGDGGAVAVVAEPATGGRQVYIGLLFQANTSYGNEGLRTGDADQLIEQAVAWASSCSDEDKDGFSTCANDCDDADPNRFPGNAEICDGIDNDCDELIPDDELDLDADGFRICDDDCDDDDSASFPGAEELCDGLDNDCDNVVPSDELDEDEDGFFACEGDCDDDDPSAFPGNPEVCDGIDNDCNDEADDGLEFIDIYPDADGDGFGDADLVESVCDQPEGYVTEPGDCDDNNGAAYPGAEEIKGNDIDENCDGEDLGGCGCTAAPASGGASLVGLLGLLATLRRRRS